MEHVPIYGWQSYGVSRYRHFCGARISRKGNKWLARFVGGSIWPGHRTAKAAVAFVETNDIAYWTFDQSTSLGSIAGLWIETAFIDGIHRNHAFIASTTNGKKPAKSVENIFRTYVFGIAICAKCSRPMGELLLTPKLYFGSWGRQLRSGKGWTFIVCECGHPVWRGDITKAEVKLSRLEKDWERKFRIRNAEGFYTPDDIANLNKLQDGRCLYCDCRFTSEKTYTIDHIEPLTSGGSHWPANLCLACRVCNGEKSGRGFVEFVSSLDLKNQKKIFKTFSKMLGYWKERLGLSASL